MTTARACICMAAPPGWPRLQVLAVPHPDGAHDADAVTRTRARERVREVLAAQAGAGLAAAFVAAPRARRGAGRVSVSHETAVSLLAWCEHGRVGVDVVAPVRLAEMDAAELAATATLFLGPDAARDIGGDRLRYAHAWARHEARLKCLGLELTEWADLPTGRLNDCEVAEVRLADGADAPTWVGWVAWRDAQISADMIEGEKSALSSGLLPRVHSSRVAAGIGRAKK